MDKPQGVGGTLISISYVGSDQASTIHPPKNQEFQARQIDIWTLSNPKNILHSVPWPSEKALKCIEMTSKYSPILLWPPKNVHKIFIPPKIFSNLKNPKKNWNSKFWTPVNSPSLGMYENIRVPPPPPPPAKNGQTDLCWRFSLLLKSEMSNIFFCLASLIKVHAYWHYQIKGHLD